VSQECAAGGIEGQDPKDVHIYPCHGHEENVEDYNRHQSHIEDREEYLDPRWGPGWVPANSGYITCDNVYAMRPPQRSCMSGDLPRHGSYPPSLQVKECNSLKYRRPNNMPSYIVYKNISDLLFYFSYLCTNVFVGKLDFFINIKANFDFTRYFGEPVLVEERIISSEAYLDKDKLFQKWPCQDRCNNISIILTPQQDFVPTIGYRFEKLIDLIDILRCTGPTQ
jgi:hypothetical protein